MRSDLTDIEVQVHHQTDRAYLVSTSGERDEAVWIPKSACEFEKTRGQHVGRLLRGTLTLPEHIAIEKGLA